MTAFACGITVEDQPFQVVYRVPADEWHFIGGLFLNVAIGIGIATVISELVERQSRMRAMAEHDRLAAEVSHIVQASTKAVARNVWGADASVHVLDEIIASNFLSPLLRENFFHRIIFSRIEGRPGAVHVGQLISYTVLNPSSRVEIFEPRQSFDDTSLIYNVETGYVRPTITELKIGNKLFSKGELIELNSKLYTGSEFTPSAIPLGEYRLPPESNTKVRLMWESVEPIDSQWVSRIFVPNKGVKVSVLNHVGSSFKVFLMPLFRGDFGQRDWIGNDGKEWECAYEGVVLPHSGWVLRWNEVQAPDRAHSS
jgi:hypothetical protein